VYLLVFIQNLLVHLGEKILLPQPLTFGGDYHCNKNAAVNFPQESLLRTFTFFSSIPIAASFSTSGA